MSEKKTTKKAKAASTKVSKKEKKPLASTIYYSGTACGTIFWSESLKKTHYIHENDGEWRGEYFSGVLSLLGAEAIYKKDKPQWVADELSAYDDEDNDEESEEE